MESRRELYHDNSKKIETLTNGVQITGSEFISEGTILLEKSGAHHHRILSNDSGNDLAFFSKVQIQEQIQTLQLI
ncbi:MAG: hypothetical protein CM15mP10_0240 [Actinomycetota bacterium]|nr:MAG: hypothetical protein CM15mP10_0240 [Actinomycetota bacterium]